MELEEILETEAPALMRRLRPMVGSLETAEDLTQETIARALTAAPRAAGEPQLRAWLHRVAANLAVDDLRKRARRRLEPFDDAMMTVAATVAPDETLAAREALEQMSAQERLLLLLRFQGGLTHAEIARLLDISETAARQRLSRARRAFAAAFQALPRDAAPRVLVLMGEDEPEPYLQWLREAGADARVLRRERYERELVMADAVVVGGSRADVHPTIYGERPHADLIDPNLVRDRQDIAVIRAALEQDIPIIGVCRGHQLLNIAFGGTLHQDLTAERVATDHPDRHAIHSTSGSFTRRVLGARASVSSRHHQAVKRPGRGLRVVSISHDGLIEAVELPRQRFALGVQFHPEDEPSPSDRRLAIALVDAAARRAA